MGSVHAVKFASKRKSLLSDGCLMAALTPPVSCLCRSATRPIPVAYEHLVKTGLIGLQSVIRREAQWQVYTVQITLELACS